jgi:peptidoglycan/xylan/chitin deacetylase (PgdA/CDA1 family)
MRKLLWILFVSQIILLLFWFIAWHFNSFPSFKTNPLFFATPVYILPVRNAPPSIIDNVIRHGKREDKKIALSFDADMTYEKKEKLLTDSEEKFFHEEIVEILNKEKIPATFFFSGLWAEIYPQAVKNIFDNPHFEIGSHSFSHLYFAPPCPLSPAMSPAKKEEEIKLTQETLKKITGQYPKLFRFPGGCYSPKDLKLTKKYGLSVVHWDVDSKDGLGASKEEIVRLVKEGTQGGSIILFHLHSPNTVEVLPEIINSLQGEKFVFVKVGDLLKGS